MDEDNDKAFKEPTIRPMQTVDEKVYEEMKKKVNEERKAKEERSINEAKIAKESMNNEPAPSESAHINTQAASPIMPNTQDVNSEKNDLIEARKAEYKAMAEKVQAERKAREERIEARKVLTETVKPNQNGSKLKSISYVLYTLAVIVGVVMIFSAGVVNGLLIGAGLAICACICSGIGEIISLLQKIYDILYYQKIKR